MNVFRRLLHDFNVRHFAPPELATEKLSSAIRRGVDLGYPEGGLFYGCAIGTGFRAKTGRILSGPSAVSKVAVEFRMPYEPVQFVSNKHWAHGWTREQCADWLESKGY